MAHAELIEEILAKLRKSAKRLTPQRLRILRTVVESDEHLDAEQIRERAGSEDGPVSYATVYRTMRMLVDEGVIKERHFKDGSARFEYVRDGEHHDHLICTDCNQVVEFANETIESLQEVVAAAHGFQMSAHRHEIYGLCGNCQRAATSPGERRQTSKVSPR